MIDKNEAYCRLIQCISGPDLKHKGGSMTFTETKLMHSHCSRFYDFGIALKPINRSFQNLLIKTIFTGTLI